MQNKDLEKQINQMATKVHQENSGYRWYSISFDTEIIVRIISIKQQFQDQMRSRVLQ